MSLSFSYRHLCYFWVVGTEGRIARAAARLGMAVQTVSTQVRELERSLGFALLKPAGRGLVLTPAGTATMQQARQIFALGAQLPAFVRESVSAPSVRALLDQWFEKHGIRPTIVGEFEDSALLKTFGASGMGVFPAVELVHDELVSRYAVKRVGPCEGVNEQFFAIGTERKKSAAAAGSANPEIPNRAVKRFARSPRSDQARVLQAVSTSVRGC